MGHDSWLSQLDSNTNTIFPAPRSDALYEVRMLVQLVQ